MTGQHSACFTLNDGTCIAANNCYHGPGNLPSKWTRNHPWIVAYDPQYKMVYVRCEACRRVRKYYATLDMFTRWLEEDESIQNVMPHIDIDGRELLISGTCGKCFDKLFDSDVELLISHFDSEEE